jgi:hypothetical protein
MLLPAENLPWLSLSRLNFVTLEEKSPKIKCFPVALPLHQVVTKIESGSKATGGSVFVETFIFAQLVMKFSAIVTPEGAFQGSRKHVRGLVLSQLNPVHIPTPIYPKSISNVTFPSSEYEFQMYFSSKNKSSINTYTVG